MTTEYDTLDQLVRACHILDQHGIGWAAASARRDNPFGGDNELVYTLHVTTRNEVSA